VPIFRQVVSRDDGHVANQPAEVAMQTFSERIGYNADGTLEVDGVSCTDLAEVYGTPLFVVSEGQIRDNVQAFSDAFTARYPRTKVLFATKANNNLAVRRVYTRAGAGGDAFGVGELLVTLLAGTPPEWVVLNGFNKGDEELELAIDSGVTIHLDAIDELDRVIAMADRVGRPARVGIRVRLLLHGLDEFKSDWPAAGSDPDGESIGLNMRERDKFGVAPSEMTELCRRAIAAPQIDLHGLHHHLGRELADENLYRVTVTEMLNLAAELRDSLGWTPSYFDFGGGMAWGRPEGHGPLAHDVNVPDYHAYAEAITSAFRTGLAAHRLGEPQLMVEPGRALASNTAILVCKVGATKPVPETNQLWVGVDASQGHMPNNLTGAFYYHPVPVQHHDDDVRAHTNIADPNCWYGNLVFDRELPTLDSGELIAFLDTGAYCETKAGNFNLLPRPATVLACEGAAELVTERETLSDVVGRMRVPTRLVESADPDPVPAAVEYARANGVDVSHLDVAVKVGD
jgi:diaminopimelate decarboxylase